MTQSSYTFELDGRQITLPIRIDEVPDTLTQRCILLVCLAGLEDRVNMFGPTPESSWRNWLRLQRALLCEYPFRHDPDSAPDSDFVFVVHYKPGDVDEVLLHREWVSCDEQVRELAKLVLLDHQAKQIRERYGIPDAHVLIWSATDPNSEHTIDVESDGLGGAYVRHYQPCGGPDEILETEPAVYFDDVNEASEAATAKAVELGWIDPEED